MVAIKKYIKPPFVSRVIQFDTLIGWKARKNFEPVKQELTQLIFVCKQHLFDEIEAINDNTNHDFI